MESATIMMVTYNRLDLTKRTLDCLFKNTLHPFNLVIVDNGSKDDTVEYLKDKLPNLVGDLMLKYDFIENTENKGIAIGRNQGLVAADELDTEWFVTIDNDVWVPKGWLTEAINILQNNRQYGGIGVNMEGVAYPVVKLGSVEFQDKPRGNLGTACMVFPKTLHEMLGYFNHLDFGKYGEEDADFGMRTRVVGLKLGYIEENGRHLGEGELDVGPYREFKTASHQNNLAKFNQNCRAYAQRKKPLYIPFET